MTELYQTQEEHIPWQLWRVETLFLRVLLRALADLQEPDRELRNSAVRWFQDTGSYLPHGISYQDVLENVDIGYKLMAQINRDICSYAPTKKIA